MRSRAFYLAVLCGNGPLGLWGPNPRGWQKEGEGPIGSKTVEQTLGACLPSLQCMQDLRPTPHTCVVQVQQRVVPLLGRRYFIAQEDTHVRVAIQVWVRSCLPPKLTLAPSASGQELLSGPGEGDGRGSQFRAGGGGGGGSSFEFGKLGPAQPPAPTPGTNPESAPAHAPSKCVPVTVRGCCAHPLDNPMCPTTRLALFFRHRCLRPVCANRRPDRPSATHIPNT